MTRRVSDSPPLTPAERSRKWRLAHPDRHIARQRKWYATLSTDTKAIRTLRYRLAARYGITVEQYDKMLADQNGVCYLCGHPPKTRRLYVDHDHGPSKRVRGLLCFRCNRALPAYLGSEWFRRAADYIDRDYDGRK